MTPSASPLRMKMNLARSCAGPSDPASVASLRSAAEATCAGASSRTSALGSLVSAISVGRTALIIFALLSLARLGGAAQPAVRTPEDLMARLKEGKPGYTEAEAQSYVRELIPLVEKAAGRRFKTLPKVKLVNRAGLIPVLAAEFAPQIRRLDPNLTAAELRADSEEMSRDYAMCFLGKYGIGTGKLYLLPRNFQPLMDVAEVDPKYRRQIVEIVIAHELTHALQDQYVSIAKLEQTATSTEERSLAFAATLEGFAVFVQDAVADQLKISGAAKELARLIALGSVKGADPSMEVASQRDVEIVRSVYLSGRDFIAWQFRHGGFEQVWRVLASPPTKTSQVFHPETYCSYSPPERGLDWSRALKGLEARIGGRKWTVDNKEVGEMELRAAYIGFDEKTREAILSDIEHAQRLVATSGECEVRIGLVVLKDRSMAPALVSATEKSTIASLEKMRGSKIYETHYSRPANFAEMTGKADIARRISGTMRHGGRIYVFSLVQVARGPVVAYVAAEGINAPPSQVAFILREVLKRTESGKF